MDCKIGRVQAIHNGSIEVLVERHSACSGCHAKGVCGSTDKKDATFTITDYPMGLHVGDQVRIVPNNTGKPLKAVVFAFIIPLVILLLEVVLFSMLEIRENTLLIILIASLALYTLVLWLFRGYFEKTFRLKAETSA